MVVGGWARRRSTDFGPFFVYAALLFAFSALVSAVHVPGGTFIHSAVALAPYSYILALEGIVVAIGWVAARRPAWDADTAVRVFGGATLVFAVVVADRRARSSSTPSGRRGASDFLAVARALDAAGRPGQRPGHVDRRVRRPATGPGTAASSWSTIRSTRSTRSPRPTTSAGSSSTAATRSRPWRPSSTARTHPAWLGQPILAEGSPTAPRRLPGAGRRHDPPRGGPDRGRDLRRRARGPRSSFAGQIVVPEARGHRLLLRRRAEPRRGPRARVRRAVELPDAAARVPARRRSRSGCRCRRSSPRSRWRSSARRSRRRSGRRSSSARSCRSSPGGSPPTSPRSAACRTARARTLAIGTGPDDARSTCRCSSTRPCPTRRCRSRSSPWPPAC